MVLITGAHKALALAKAIEEGVNHMWTVSAFQQHPQSIFVCDEDATLELRVKTVKYFQGDADLMWPLCDVFWIAACKNSLFTTGLMDTHNKLVETPLVGLQKK